MLTVVIISIIIIIIMITTIIIDTDSDRIHFAQNPPIEAEMVNFFRFIIKWYWSNSCVLYIELNFDWRLWLLAEKGIINCVDDLFVDHFWLQQKKTHRIDQMFIIIWSVRPHIYALHMFNKKDTQTNNENRNKNLKCRRKCWLWVDHRHRKGERERPIIIHSYVKNCN